MNANIFGLVNNMLFPDTYYGGINTGAHSSFRTWKWFVWPLKQIDNAEFLYSLLSYNNATYMLNYRKYNKQSV